MNRLSLAGTDLEYFHVCAFFNSREEEYAVLGPFYKEGLDQGEKAFHIIDPGMADHHRTQLGAAGIDVAHCESCGQLSVEHWQQVYLDETGSFDKDKMLAAVDQLTSGSGEDRARHVRIMGDMGWVFEDVPGVGDILEYEAEVNDVLSRNRQPAVCVYDVAKLSGAMMMDLLRTHPLTLIGGLVQENPFYTPPQQMLAELRARRHGAS